MYGNLTQTYARTQESQPKAGLHCYFNFNLTYICSVLCAHHGDIPVVRCFYNDELVCLAFNTKHVLLILRYLLLLLNVSWFSVIRKT